MIVVCNQVPAFETADIGGEVKEMPVFFLREFKLKIYATVCANDKSVTLFVQMYAKRIFYPEQDAKKRNPQRAIACTFSQCTAVPYAYGSLTC